MNYNEPPILCQHPYILYPYMGSELKFCLPWRHGSTFVRMCVCRCWKIVVKQVDLEKEMGCKGVWDG